MLDKKPDGFRVEAVVPVEYEMDGKRGTYYRVCISEMNAATQCIKCKLVKSTKDFAEYCVSLGSEIIHQRIAYDDSERACALY